MSSVRNSLPRLTNTQTVQLEQDLALVEERLQDVAIFVRLCYGENSQPAIRVGETAGALQRLKWALERTTLSSAAAGPS